MSQVVLLGVFMWKRFTLLKKITKSLAYFHIHLSVRSLMLCYKTCGRLITTHSIARFRRLLKIGFYSRICKQIHVTLFWFIFVKLFVLLTVVGWSHEMVIKKHIEVYYNNIDGDINIFTGCCSDKHSPHEQHFLCKNVSITFNLNRILACGYCNVAF